MILLLLSIGALILGPWLYRLWSRGHAVSSVVDGFVFVAISGMVVLLILPESVADGGWVAILWALAGALGPTLSEHLFRDSRHRSHNVALFLGLVGIAFHSLLDGAALGEAGRGSLLPLAVILHRFPVGLAVWWLVRPHFGTRAATGVLALVAVGTIGGFVAGPVLLEHASFTAVAWFEALVAGALVHVVVHRPHHEERHREDRRLEGLGALAGVVLVVLLMVSETTSSPASSRIGQAFLGLALESAPALLLAYLMAGFMSVLLPRSTVEWMRRGSPWMQAFRGMTVGLPLPICSCGVVPLYRTLVLKGAPMAAAMAFLVATPELGLDAVFLSVPLLGIKMTIIRVVGAFLVAMTVGWVVARLSPSAGGEAIPVTVVPEPAERGSAWDRVRQAMAVGFGEVVDHTAPWIILGLVIAALATPLIQTGMLAAVPRGLDVVVFGLVGLPIYVCAAAATPLVAVLLAGGISPGAALAFLLTGPATNVTTFGVLTQLHGRRTALTFSVSIIGLSLGLGLLTNAIVPSVSGLSVAELTGGHASVLQVVSLVALAGAVLASIIRRGARAFVAEVTFQTGVPATAQGIGGH